MAFHDKLRKLLSDAGLTEAQIFVYLALLKKPMDSIWTIVKRTGLPKSTVYDAFYALKKFQMVEKNKIGIRALSLKAFIAELKRKQRKTDKTAYKLQQLAPFLHAPNESIEELETFYTPDQIAEAYLFMSRTPYDINLDFGDYENFINAIGGNELGIKFRENRVKHATHRAICTTYGPNLAYFCNREDQMKFKNQFNVRRQINFRNHWIIFSDTSDYVLFNDVSDCEYPVSTLIKSKLVADIQRMNFRNYSELFRNS